MTANSSFPFSFPLKPTTRSSQQRDMAIHATLLLFAVGFSHAPQPVGLETGRPNGTETDLVECQASRSIFTALRSAVNWVDLITTGLHPSRSMEKGETGDPKYIRSPRKGWVGFEQLGKKRNSRTHFRWFRKKGCWVPDFEEHPAVIGVRSPCTGQD